MKTTISKNSVYPSYSILVSILIICLLHSGAWGQDVITVKVEENQSVRQISEKYLGDPNLWEDILRANNLKSAVEVKPGMTLRIPAKLIMRTNEEMNRASDMINEADKAGAKIFAVAVVDSAIVLKDQALVERKNGEWEKSYNLAKSAFNTAQRAYEICLDKREVAGDAKLNYAQGSVQNRKPIDLAWNDIQTGVLLYEGEKVRTLSKSIAEILLQDQSRFRLDENSQMMIQEMKVNILENRSRSTISLLEGDFYALLGGGKPGEDFQLEVPGVQTGINSKNFRIARDENSAKFANYDGQLSLTAAGQTVVLEENQGSVVPHNQAPSKPQELLPLVKLAAPSAGMEVYESKTKLKWEKVAKAKLYWLEIALDKNFRQVIKSVKIKNPFFQIPALSSGVYYWRVAGIDAMGLVGPICPPWSFTLIYDIQPPYLTLYTPQEYQTSYQKNMTIRGECEKGAILTLNGQPITPDENGAFTADCELEIGNNEIIIKAGDIAGNITELVRTVTYLPAGAGSITFDPSLIQILPNEFLSADRAFNISGITNPGYEVEIVSQYPPFQASAFADEGGGFTFGVVLRDSVSNFTLNIISPAGEITAVDIKVTLDVVPPNIVLASPLPSVTAIPTLNLSGRVEGGIILKINENEVPLTDGNFDYTLQLEPRKNHIVIFSEDAAGNETILEKTITLDNKPPSLLKYEIKPQKVKGGESASILLYAEDESGMKKAALFTVQIGDFVFTGILKYSSASNRFESIVAVPANVSGIIKLKRVKLEDIHGNVKTFEL